MRGQILRLLRVFIASLVCGQLTWAANAQALRPTYTLTDWFPYAWMHEGEPRGFLVELARAVDESVGLNSPIALAPVPRVIHLMKSGQYDLSIIFRGDKLEDKVNHLFSFACIQTAVVSLKDNPIRQFDDLNGQRVAFSNSGYFISNQRPDLDIEGVQVASPAMMFRMLLRGRIQALVTDEAVLAGYHARLNKDYTLTDEEWSRIAAPFYLEKLELTLASPKAKDLGPLKHQFSSIKNNPELLYRVRSIFNDYGMTHTPTCPPDQ